MMIPAISTSWRKSSHSTTASNCVEIALAAAVSVRDSKNANGSILSYPTDTWTTFLTALK